MTNSSHHMLYLHELDYDMYHISNTEKLEVRKIQAIHGETTFVLVIPNNIAENLRIGKGDYVKCTIVEDSLVVRIADL
jgi:hypothetical protein